MGICAKHRSGLRFDTAILDQFTVPPDILAHLSRRLATATKPFPDPRSVATHQSELGAVRPCHQTERICEIYDSLAVASRQSFPHNTASGGLLSILARGRNHEWLDDLPNGIAVPLLEMIRFCQTKPMPNRPAHTYAFIGRSDLAMQCLGEMSDSRDLATVEVSRLVSKMLTLDRWRRGYSYCGPAKGSHHRQLQHG